MQSTDHDKIITKPGLLCNILLITLCVIEIINYSLTTPSTIFTFLRRLVSSWGWSFWTSPICSAAAFLVIGVEPLSRSTHSRSSLKIHENTQSRDYSTIDYVTETVQNELGKLEMDMQGDRALYTCIRPPFFLTPTHSPRRHLVHACSVSARCSIYYVMLPTQRHWLVIKINHGNHNEHAQNTTGSRKEFCSSFFRGAVPVDKHHEHAKLPFYIFSG